MIRSGLACFAALLVAAAPAAAATPRYGGAALGNAPGGGKVREHDFAVGDSYQLRFRDRRGAHTRYRVCLTQRGQRLNCFSSRTGARKAAGYSEGLALAEAPPAGRYTYVWYVKGAAVAHWGVVISAGD